MDAKKSLRMKLGCALLLTGSFGGLYVSQLVAQAANSTSTQAPGSAPAARYPQSAGPAQPSTQAQGVTPATAAAAPARPAPAWRGSQVTGLSQRAEMYYQGVWGVDELRVKSAESGQLIRFNYRVLDPARAAVLNDKKMEPELYDAQARVKLSVPQMEKVGKLRQQSSPKPGMTYWMVFSNPTLAVKRGHRVDVVIGSFHAANLVVE